MADQTLNAISKIDVLTQKEKIRLITDKLEAGVKELFESRKYKEYLSCMSKFHNYSINNTLLIAIQRPNATLVAGFQTWKKDHGRIVKRGEKGIRILAPYKYKVEKNKVRDDEEPVVEEMTGFRVVSVFDVSQTEGKALLTIGINELAGSVKNYEKLFKALIIISDVPIRSEEIKGDAKGYYNDAEKRIGIRKGMSEAQTIKTMIHEIAHQKLHSKDTPDSEKPFDRRTKEVEAESVAYTFCRHYGIDSSDYSFGYIAGWSSGKETKELKQSLERIRATADEMITRVDRELEKQKARERNGQER